MKEYNNDLIVPNVYRNIYMLRGQIVMLDTDLAKIYEVGTKRLNEQVSRNSGRFPDVFCFRISDKEKDILRSQNATANISPKSRVNPRVFTEYGIITLAGVLKSKVADEAAMKLAQQFVDMRKRLNDKNKIIERIDQLEKQQEIILKKHIKLEDMQRIQFKELLTKMNLITKHIFLEKNNIDKKQNKNNNREMER